MFEKLTKLQNELKAPKSQFNRFGNYNYRSLEDITEAVKPLLLKYGLSLVLNDEIVMVGERYYVKATAILHDDESNNEVVCTAYARESSEAKGMSDSQLSGAASSYARKYVMNAMFLIDDTKDDDSNEAKVEQDARAKRQTKNTNAKNPDAFPEIPATIGDNEKAVLKEMCEKAGKDINVVFPKGLDLTSKQYTQAVQTLTGWIQAKEGKK